MSQSRDTYDDRQPIWEKRWTERSADTVVRKKKKTKETSARGPQRWPQRAISPWELLLLLLLLFHMNIELQGERTKKI